MFWITSQKKISNSQRIITISSTSWLNCLAVDSVAQINIVNNEDDKLSQCFLKYLFDEKVLQSFLNSCLVHPRWTPLASILSLRINLFQYLLTLQWAQRLQRKKSNLSWKQRVHVQQRYNGQIKLENVFELNLDAT